ncbi:MAG: fasciclin domain-containing protein [Planctomycetota bacterium]
MNFLRITSTVLLVSSTGLSAQTVEAAATRPAADIVGVATESGSFKTLLAAAKAAGMVEALQGKGPLTLFAPTDAAFEKLGKKTIDSLLDPKNKAKLAAILSFHVVPGELKAAKVVSAGKLQSLQGEPLTVEAGKQVKVGGALVTKTDIPAKNGVIHVLDSVMLPPERQDIVATAQAAGSFATLAKALQAGDLVEALQGEGPFTVFAPTDAAFAKLDSATLEGLLRPENKDKLVAILKSHVVSGRVLARDVVDLRDVRTLSGNRLAIVAGEEGVRVGGAKVVQTDVLANNGVIHVIDTVIVPTTDK